MCVIVFLLFTSLGLPQWPQCKWKWYNSDLLPLKRSKGSRHCISALTTALCPWAASTDVRMGLPFPYHAIHGVAVVNGAMGYQIWRRGCTARPHLTDTCQGINWPDVTFRHPSFTHSRSGAWCWSGEYTEVKSLTISSYFLFFCSLWNTAGVKH